MWKASFLAGSLFLLQVWFVSLLYCVFQTLKRSFIVKLDKSNSCITWFCTLLSLMRDPIMVVHFFALAAP
jgi:hypothetical protein